MDRVTVRRSILAICTALFLACGVARAQEASRHREAILLVAHPGMPDPRFAQTVVLVTFPPDTGPMGVVLNRPTPLELRSIWPDRADRKGRTELLNLGGPVQPDDLLFVFRMSPPPKKAQWVTGDIYLSGDSEILERLLAIPEPPGDQRFFAGYAGWARGQLEYEIETGGWYLLPPDPQVIFEMKPLEMWERMIERATLPRA